MPRLRYCRPHRSKPDRTGTFHLPGQDVYKRDVYKRQEDLLAEHIEILNADWLLIGRQARTVVGKYIDLLCMDHEGDLIVVELKRDLTPREVTAQAIDYASCVADMKLEEFADLYLHTSNGALTLNDAYQKKFGRPLDEDVYKRQLSVHGKLTT